MLTSSLFILILAFVKFSLQTFPSSRHLLFQAKQTQFTILFISLKTHPKYHQHTMFKQLNLKKSLITLSQFSMGDEPNVDQVKSIQSLGLDLSKPFTEMQDEHLLISLHSLITRQSVSNTSQAPYSRTGVWWKHSLGFQRTDPVSDIRGGGILSLHNLIYFLANHPKTATQMIHSRANRPLSADNTYPSFPWACAGINLTRSLALEFDIIQPSGLSNTGLNAHYSKKTSWRYISEENGFNRMYVCLFLLLDCLWEEMNATYMDFNHVLEATSEEFKLHLALSSSLTNLENRVHKRVDFVDPDISDYTSLPPPAAHPDPSSESSPTYHDMMEGGQLSQDHWDYQRPVSSSQSRNLDLCSPKDTDTDTDTATLSTSPLLNFLATQLTVPSYSYEGLMASLVPEPEASCLPDFLCGEQQQLSQQQQQEKQQQQQQQYQQQYQQQQQEYHQPHSLRHRSPYNMQIV